MTDQNPDRIVTAPEPTTVGRSATAGARLLDPTVSREHATVHRVPTGVAVKDLESRYGTFVNGMRIMQSEARLGDRIQFGTSLVYRVEADCLIRDQVQGISLTAIGISVGREGRRLLEGISFDIRPNTFVGILAPSGAGKSTLLNCLGGYLEVQTGQLRFDDVHDVTEQLESYRNKLGYVTQDDIVYSALSVEENLVFAAKLRVGTAIESPHVKSLVERAMERTDLTNQRDSHANRLSGGQRKRLSVAVELLQRPRLLLLDEPTSGLDPATEASLMEHLRQLARQGTTTICTTHLMDNLGLFDEVLVLGRKDGVGRVAYHGDPADLLSHFACRNFADLYERLEDGAFDPLSKRETAPSSDAADGHFAAQYPTTLGNAARNGSVSRSRDIWRATRTLVAEVMASPKWLQLLLVCWRAAVVLSRDRMLMTALLVQPLILASLVCFTQYRPDMTRMILFFLVILAIWFGMNNVIRDLVRDRKLYLRDRLAGLHPGAYFASKAVFYGLIGVVQIVLVLVVLAISKKCFFHEQTVMSLNEIPWARLSNALMLSYLGAMGLGLIASAMVRTEAAAVAMLPLLLMPQLLLSSVVTNQVNESYDHPRAFRPIALAVTSFPKTKAAHGAVSVAVDLLSLGTFSRPAVIVAEAPRVPDSSRWIWVGDFFHLLFLLCVIWTLAYVVFRRSESRWLRLLDLD